MSDPPVKELNAIGKSARNDYKKLLKKYKEQQKIISELKANEKFELREQFKNLGAGRKKKYTPLRLKNKIIDYFAKMKALDRPPTKSGLMVHLKMHRDQFYQYAGYPEFKDIMEQTATMIENWYEEALILNKYSGSGIQFALKNRFGWTDTQTVQVNNTTDEKQLISKIESLAPELAEIFKNYASTERAKTIEHKTIEAEVISNGSSFEDY